MILLSAKNEEGKMVGRVVLFWLWASGSNADYFKSATNVFKKFNGNSAGVLSW